MKGASKFPQEKQTHASSGSTLTATEVLSASLAAETPALNLQDESPTTANSSAIYFMLFNVCSVNDTI